MKVYDAFLNQSLVHELIIQSEYSNAGLRYYGIGLPSVLLDHCLVRADDGDGHLLRERMPVGVVAPLQGLRVTVGCEAGYGRFSWLGTVS